MCDLCERQPITYVYHEDDLVWIADCVSCCCPMAVIKRHAVSPTDREVEHIAMLKERIAPDASWDDTMRSIGSHYHVHWRPR